MGKQEQNTSNSALKRLDKLSTLIFYLAILFFIIGFNFTDVPPGPFWYQQFMPNIGGRQVNDITFTDSLNGYAITSFSNDTSFILRTTNGGNNWFVSHWDTAIANYYRIQFINQNTGFVGGYIERAYIVRTTNAGINWFYINAPYDQIALDMSVTDENSIWIVDNNSLVGGIFHTSNGGASWTQQYYMPNQNPSKIYMYNSRIGFASSTAGLLKTTNSGASWFVASNSFQFQDMHFTDSLTGWKCFGQTDSIQHTTDGGFNWVKQILPPEGVSGGLCLFYSRMYKFSFVNKDTIWGVGGVYSCTGFNFRGIIYKTTNGGINWGYQLPDTHTVSCPDYSYISFINNFNGWAYGSVTGAHTVTGGDTTLLSAHQISSEIPKDFQLFQNYPNPFNPNTKIKYQIVTTAYIILKVYDISGREIETLVAQKQAAGIYEVNFSGDSLSSGVYFYKLIVNDTKEVKEQTKKMILIK